MTEKKGTPKDPYLSELDELGDLASEEPTRVDLDMEKTEPKGEEKSPDKSKGSKAKAAPPGPAKELLDLAPDIPVNVVVVMGRKELTVKDLLGFRMGEIVDLDRPPNEAVDLMAGGRVIARGELVVIEGRLGVRITKMLK